MQKTAARRAVTNENDENVANTRVTRAKAAALDNPAASDVLKKPLQRSKSTTTGIAQLKKRAVLGDKSNIGAPADSGDKEGKALKKPVASKAGPISKAAQPTGVQKLSRSQSTRSILGPKDRISTNVSDLKRPASGSGATGHVSKKRATGSSTSTKSISEEYQHDENVAPNGQTVEVEIEKTVTTTKISVAEPVPVKSTTPQGRTRVLPVGVDNLDDEDVNDPLMVSEYVHEIFDYLREIETETMANKDYMDNQPDLEWKMRGILVDWLLEVHTRFRLLPETLFLAVNIIDRFLSTKIVQLDRLQLVGVTAMFIASKYEEVLAPHVQNFRHVADDGFTEEEILSAERFVLQALNYDLRYPNPMNFLRRISKADSYDVQTRTVGKYLLEISCLDHRFLEYPPSQVSAAAMFLARLILDSGDWVNSLDGTFTLT